MVRALLTVAVVTGGGLAAARPTDKLDAIFASVTDDRSPGVAVLVRQKGRTLFERGYGVRELRARTKIDAHTNFRLASLTKQFTATAIMLLVRDGKLRYEQTLGELLPGFPEYGKNITLKHILNHCSGLPDYEDLMEKRPGAWSVERQISDEEVLALLEAEPAGRFAPGTRWSYSNSGYVLLGVIVLKVSGKPFREFLRERIFAPLGMTHTLAYQKGENQIPDRAFGHAKSQGGWVEADQSATSATLGDGGVYSCLEDLKRWDDALGRHTLVSEREMAAALTPAKLAGGSTPRWPDAAGADNLHPGQPVAYGFGWFRDPYRGHERMWHHGTSIGFRAVIERFLDKTGVSIIVLCNRTDLDPEKLALAVADVILSQ